MQMNEMMNPYLLRFFGPGLLVDQGGQAIAVRSRKQLALLVYLASEHQTAHSRDTLLSLLWPDEERPNAQNNLRFTLSHLRSLSKKMAVNGSELPAILVADRHTVQIHPEWVMNADVNHFQQLLDSTRQHSHSSRSQCQACQQALAQAVTLYEQEFMAGFGLDDCAAFEEWLFVQREQLYLLVCEAYGDLATYAESHADYLLARDCAQRQIELDPLREPAYRQQMRILARLGERSAALALFERCRSLLNEELGLDPEPETLTLHVQILNSEVPSSTSEESPETAAFASSVHGQSTALVVSNNLPQQLTPFIGREEELVQLQRRLADPAYRLLTLVGPGGMGKTRLSIQAANANQHRFAQGVCFVPLAGVQRAEEIPASIIEALNVNFASNETSPTQQLLTLLAPLQMLLVIDNFEHLMAGVDLLLAILQRAPDVTILVTSREQLNCQAEDLFYLDGLSTPTEDDFVHAGQSAAVRLFCDRAHRISKEFKLTAENYRHVAQICQLVAGMPLAIELAVSWTPDFPLPQLADTLRNDLDMLQTTQRDVPPQHRSMRAVFDQSWALLSPAEQGLLSRFSVFRGGFDLDAAQQVADASPLGLVHLRHKSMLRAEGPGRYGIHELLRQFAAEKLARDESELAARGDRHSNYYLGLVQQQEEVLNGRSPKAGLLKIRQDLDNVRLAWVRATEAGAVSMLEKTLPALARFHELNGTYAEAESVFEQTLAQMAAITPHPDARSAPTLYQPDPDKTASRVTVQMMAALADLAHSQSKDQKAIDMATQAIVLAQQIGDAASEALACLVAARVYLTRGDNDQAVPLLEQGINQAQAAGKTTLEATLRRHVGNVWRQRGDFDQEAAYLEQARALLATSQDQAQMQTVLNWLGHNFYHRGMYEQSRESIEQALAFNDRVGDPSRISKSQDGLGQYELIMGNTATARRLFEKVIDVNERIRDPWQLGYTVLNLAETARSEGKLSEALTQGQRATEIAQRHALRELEADGLLVLGYVSIDRLAWTDGESYFCNSLAHWQTIGNRVKIVEAGAGLAYCLWQLGQSQEALTQVAEVISQLLSEDLYGCIAPLLPHFLAARVLQTLEPERATALEKRIDQILQREAGYFTDPDDRVRFLGNHPVVRAQRRHA